MWSRQIRNRSQHECVYVRVCVCVCFVTFLPCTRKQKSFHISRRVSFVKPSASYSTTPLQYTNIHFCKVSHLQYFLVKGQVHWQTSDSWTHVVITSVEDAVLSSWLTFQSGWERRRYIPSSCDSLGWHTAPRENKVKGSAHTKELQNTRKKKNYLFRCLFDLLTS